MRKLRHFQVKGKIEQYVKSPNAINIEIKTGIAQFLIYFETQIINSRTRFKKKIRHNLFCPILLTEILHSTCKYTYFVCGYNLVIFGNLFIVP
jgi:hypothetical protein